MSVVAFKDEPEELGPRSGSVRWGTKTERTIERTASEMELLKENFRPLSFQQHFELLERVHTADSQKEEDEEEINRHKIEQMEAEHYGYKDKVRPRSQMGSGGRSAHQTPPWIRPREVRDALVALKRGIRPGSEGLMDASQKIMSVLAKGITDYVQPPNFCRVTPWALAKDSFLLAEMARDDMPIHEGRPMLLSLCEMELSDKQLTHTIEDTGCDVLIGLSVATNARDIARNLPRLRTLGLCENFLQDQDMRELGDWLRGNTRLERLVVQSNSVSNAGCAHLARGLQANTALTTLKLCNNMVADEGAEAISEALYPCRCEHVVRMAVLEEQLDILEVALSHTYAEERGLVLEAARVGATKVIDYVLQLHPELLEAPDEEGHTPLMVAAMHNHVGPMSALLEWGADQYARDKAGRTAFHLAAMRGKREAVRAILNPHNNSQPDLHKPLNLRIDIEAVRALRRTADELEPAPEYNAAVSPGGSSGTVLSKRGSVAQVLRRSSIAVAAATSVVQGFAQGGMGYQPGQRPLEVTFRLTCGGNTKRTEPHIVPPLAGQTYLHKNVIFPPLVHGKEGVVELFVDCLDDQLDTTLLGMAQVPVEWLLEQHPEPLSQWVQIMGGDMQPVGWVKVRGVWVLDEMELESVLGATPLLDACARGHADVAEALLLSGADIEATDADGNTPLIAAAFGGHRDALLLLLKHHASIEACNRSGVTALTAVERRNQEHLIPILYTHLRVAKGQPINIARWIRNNQGKDRPGTSAAYAIAQEQEENPDGDEEDEEGDLEHQKEIAKFRQEEREHKKKQDTGIGFLENMYKGAFVESSLLVEVVQATGLPRADRVGLSDPYAEIRLNGVEFKTKVHKNTLDPEWNETYVFDDQTRGVWREQQLLVQVFDWNRSGAKKLLGRVSVQVLDLDMMQPKMSRIRGQNWFELFNAKGDQVFGEPAAEGEEPPPAKILLKWRFTEGAGRFVTVHVHKAINLPSNSKGKPPSSAVWIQGGGGRVESGTVLQSTAPFYGWEARVACRLQEAEINLEIRDEAEQEKGRGRLLGQLSLTAGQIDLLVQGGLSSGWIELDTEEGHRARSTEGNPAMVLVTLGLSVIHTEEEKAAERALYGPAPEPRPPPRLGEEALIAVADLKAAIDPVGWARTAFRRYAEELPREGFDQRGRPGEAVYVLRPDAVRDMLLELGRVVTPGEIGALMRVYSSYEDTDYGLLWPDICQLLGLRSGTDMRGPPLDVHVWDEIVVNRDCKAVVGLRVVLREEAIEALPGIIHDSAGGPGTIVLVDTLQDEESDKIKGLICHVLWDKTKIRRDYRTGRGGQFRLAVHVRESVFEARDMDIFTYKHKMTYLRDIDLSFNRISDRGATSLAKALAANRSVTRLNLASNKITYNGSAELGRALVSNSTLKTLMLACNMLRDEGLYELCEALKLPGAGLEVLCVEENSIGVKGARLLAKCLFSTPSLRELDLTNNLLGGDGAAYLGEGLRHAKCLVKLDLTGNVLGNKGFNALAKSFRPAKGSHGRPSVLGNSTLERLCVQRNNIGDAGCEELLLSAAQHRKLVAVDLGENTVSDAVLREIDNIIQVRSDQNKLEAAVLCLQKIWRGKLFRRNQVQFASTRSTLRKPDKYTIGMERTESATSATVEEELSPEDWAREAFVRHAIGDEGVGVGGLMLVLAALHRDVTEQACKKLIDKYAKPQGADSLQWAEFCELLDLPPATCPPQSELRGIPKADEEEEPASPSEGSLLLFRAGSSMSRKGSVGILKRPATGDRERGSLEQGVSDKEMSVRFFDEGREALTSAQPPATAAEAGAEAGGDEEGGRDEEHEGILILAEDEDRYGELELGPDDDLGELLAEAKELLKSAQHNAGALEYHNEGDEDAVQAALQSLMEMEARADQLLAEVEGAILRPRSPSTPYTPSHEAAQLVAADTALAAVDRYEELQKLLTSDDVDEAQVVAAIESLEKAHVSAIEVLSAAEAMVTENLGDSLDIDQYGRPLDKVKDDDGESDTASQAVSLGGSSAGFSGTYVREEGVMDQAEAAYQALQSLLGRQDDGEEGAEAIARALEAFEAATESAQQRIHSAERRTKERSGWDEWDEEDEEQLLEGDGDSSQWEWSTHECLEGGSRRASEMNGVSRGGDRDYAIKVFGLRHVDKGSEQQERAPLDPQMQKSPSQEAKEEWEIQEKASGELE